VEEHVYDMAGAKYLLTPHIC